MKTLLLTLCIFISCISTADAKYVKLPDGSFYPVHEGKYENDAALWYCYSFSIYPNAFFMQAPTKCGDNFYNKFKEVYFQDHRRVLSVIPLLEKNDWFLNEKQLSGNEMFCDAYTRSNLTKDYPPYQMEKQFFCNASGNAATGKAAKVAQNEGSLAHSVSETANNWTNGDVQAAILSAVETELFRTVVMIGVFFLLTIGVSRKNLSRPTHNGRWWGALLGSIVATLLAFKNPQPTFSQAYFITIAINLLLVYSVVFFVAYLWRKHLNKTQKNRDNSSIPLAAATAARHDEKYDGSVPEKSGETTQRHHQSSIAATPINAETPVITASNIAKVNATSTEEQIWALASHEMGSLNRNEGLWAKCFAEADGDDAKTKVAYLRQRVTQLTDQAKALAANEKVAAEAEESARIEAMGKPAECPQCKGWITTTTEACSHCNAWLGAGSNLKPILKPYRS